MERTGLSPTDDGEDILIPRTLLVAFLFIGCGSVKTTLPYPLTISEEGLGAIHPDTPFDQISTALSGFEFEKLNQISSDQSHTIMQIKRSHSLIAQVVSDTSGKKIATIHILTTLIKNKNHQGLGDSLPQSTMLQCEDQECYYTNEPSLHYRIDPKKRTILEITYQRL